MKISTFFKEAATDVAAIVGGGAALVGVGIGTAAAIGGVPLIAAGAAIGGAVAGPTILVGRVASHIIDGIQSKIDPEGKHNAIARTLKVLSFGTGLAAGVGVAVGIAFIPALGLTVATAASVIGAVALAAVVGYVAYLALRGICNLISAPKAPAGFAPLENDDVPPVGDNDQEEQLPPPVALNNNRERRDYIIAQFAAFASLEDFRGLNAVNINEYLGNLTQPQQTDVLNAIVGHLNNYDQGNVFGAPSTVQGLIARINMDLFPIQN